MKKIIAAATVGYLNAVADTDGIDMRFNDHESVTLRWEACAEEDRPVEVYEGLEEVGPF